MSQSPRSRVTRRRPTSALISCAAFLSALPTVAVRVDRAVGGRVRRRRDRGGGVERAEGVWVAASGSAGGAASCSAVSAVDQRARSVGLLTPASRKLEMECMPSTGHGTDERLGDRRVEPICTAPNGPPAACSPMVRSSQPGARARAGRARAPSRPSRRSASGSARSCRPRARTRACRCPQRLQRRQAGVQAEHAGRAGTSPPSGRRCRAATRRSPGRRRARRRRARRSRRAARARRRVAGPAGSAANAAAHADRAARRRDERAPMPRRP